MGRAYLENTRLFRVKCSSKNIPPHKSHGGTLYVLPLPVECHLWDCVVQMDALNGKKMGEKCRTFIEIISPQNNMALTSVFLKWYLLLKHYSWTQINCLLFWRHKFSCGIFSLVGRPNCKIAKWQSVSPSYQLCVAQQVSTELSVWVVPPCRTSITLGIFLPFPCFTEK